MNSRSIPQNDNVKVSSGKSDFDLVIQSYEYKLFIT